MGHAAAVAMNAALVMSQRQHQAWNVTLHSPIIAEHEAGPFFNLVWLDREPAYQNLRRMLNQLYQLAGRLGDASAVIPHSCC